MKIVIIGYGPAAVRALAAIERHVRLFPGQRPDVTVISAEKTGPYSPMFLIKFATGQLIRDQLSLKPEGGRYSFPFHELLGHPAVGILDKEKKVILQDGREIGFDRLLIASGAAPVVPSIKGIGKEGVFFLGRLQDAERIARALPQAREVVVIGAGAMGMEAAIAFDRLGKKVRVVEFLSQLLPKTLGAKMAEYVQGRLEARGMEFWLGCAVAEITGANKATGVVTNCGRELRGDMVLLTAGVRPSKDFVQDTTIETNQGICVNDRMETSIPDIYAAGDVAESKNRQGFNELVFNWYSAIDQGWVAGGNMMGQAKNFLFCPLLSALKEIEFPVLSIGKKGAEDTELLSRYERKKGIWEEIYVRNGFVDCYQAIGVRDKAGLFYTLIKSRKKVESLKKVLLTDGFNATGLIS